MALIQLFGRFMSKGTLTPRTVRDSVANDFGEELKEELIDLDTKSKEFYDERNTKLVEKKIAAAKTTKTMQSLEKYSAGALNGIKVKHESFEKHFKSFECPDSVLSPQDLPDNITITNIYKYRAIGENSQITSMNSPIVFHYGIKVENAHFLKGRVIDSNNLHPIEKNLIEQAVNKLDVASAATDIFTHSINNNYQHNAVLIDIIARKDAKDSEILKAKTPPTDFFNAYTKGSQHINKCTITFEPKTKSIEIHTVVLWKTGDHEISLIDPSNYKFSSFLNDKVVKEYKIKNALKDTSKLYLAEAGNNTGGIPRDCTDIAVKIAFELIEQQKNPACKSVDDALNNMTKQISNDKNLSGFDIDNFKHFKFFQSSDNALRKSAKNEVNKVKKELLKNIDASKLTTPDEMYEALELLGQLQTANSIEDLF